MPKLPEFRNIPEQNQQPRYYNKASMKSNNVALRWASEAKVIYFSVAGL